MIYYFRNFFLLLFFLIPLFLVSGPAIPDISISFGVVFGILWFLLKERKHDLLQNNFIQLSILFWLSLFLISFFAVYKEKSFQEAFIYLRYLLIPICCYFIYFKSRTVFNYFLLFVLILVILVALDTLFQFFNYTSKDGFGSDLVGPQL